MNRTALIDGDIIAYTAASWAQSRQMDGVDLLDRVRSDVKDWTRRAFCSRALVMLSCPREENFRKEFWPSYKENRDDKPKPPGLGDAVACLREEFGATTRPGLEADDLLGILGSGGLLPDGSWPVMVTIDKDLKQVPGTHFNPDKDDYPREVSLTEADQFFYVQWVAGDATDNVPGVFRAGPAKALKLLGSTPREGWDQAVLDLYEAHPQAYTAEYVVAQARCVRILRAGEWDATSRKPSLWTPNGHYPNPTNEGKVPVTQTKTKQGRATSGQVSGKPTKKATSGQV